ncbi:hypothetical protein F0919_12045 [Taibaiella lutea]|uniref:DUF4402 domain-containing protein n=1 Tax=Taibaiella lutea TaxID=2608001 RepID=A0A5M6CH66_9BACT|nr:hypothetical protein [Taibaiella lutea]KAA5533272.1 hypothetical protein F0919_12045 [Taibaiella lutea]
MKKMKLMSLLTALLIVLGYNNGNAQLVTTKNTITRNACTPGYIGCSGATVVLKLATSGQFIISKSNSYEAATESFNYPTNYTKITVTLKSPSGINYTSTAPYFLPTVVGESTIINLGADGEGVGPYTIGIYKNADKQFTLSVGYYAY